MGDGVWGRGWGGEMDWILNKDNKEIVIDKDYNQL